MTRLNEDYLQHEGCTDVITFDYSDEENPDRLAGEIFVCVPEAERQASRFRVKWELEMVRYVVHGVLHLSGYDDQTPRARQLMKKQENRFLRNLAEAFNLRKLDGHSRLE